MEAFSALVSRLVPAPAWRERLRAQRVLSRWEEIVGQGVAGAVWPRGFSRGTVVVEVPDSIWMHRLRLEERRLLARLNEAAGEELFRGLRFVLSRRPRPEPPRPGPATPPEEDLAARAARDVAAVEDPELREAFRRLRLTLLRKERRGPRPRRSRARRGAGR